MLDGIADKGRDDPSVDAVRARYQELTGELHAARGTIARAERTMDGGIDNPAYDRSWFHMRGGQLAFEAGDYDAAQAGFQESLQLFPDNAAALMWQARMFRARKEWRSALAAAAKSASLYPLPQTLGYEADAQRALGDVDGAAKTDALIGVEQRMFNLQGINDRLLANYYAQRRQHLDEALKAARGDYHKRGDEVYADDTMGWVLAAMGQWNHARVYMERAVRSGIQDPEVQYHAAVVAIHTGYTAEAKRRLSEALQRNPWFDPFEADDARTQLARLNSRK
jgi:tetratricopeptide (TPR) repeat protein